MIQILTTGGTIEGLDYDNPTRKQFKIKSVQNMIKKVIDQSEYTVEKLFNKDSRFISKEDRALIALKVSNSNSKKILLTHGTITMIETAQFLGKLNLNKTVVITGAFILGTELDTDAPFNLGYAISSLKFLDNGVYIAMNGKVFNWNNVRKNLQTNRFEILS